MKKRNRIILPVIVLVCVFGVGAIVFGKYMKKENSLEEEVVQEESLLTKPDYEETRGFFETVTLDMLNECDAEAEQRSNEEFLKAYDEDPLILLKEYSENNCKIYGISIESENEAEDAMILRFGDDYFFVELGYRNRYYEPPILSCYDVDGDGAWEAVLSTRWMTGTGFHVDRFGICEFENTDAEGNFTLDTKCVTYRYEREDYLSEIEERITARYEKEENKVVLFDGENQIYEGKSFYEEPFLGVTFSNQNQFLTEPMQLVVTAELQYEASALPVSVCDLYFNVIYENGTFSIK